MYVCNIETFKSLGCVTSILSPTNPGFVKLFSHPFLKRDTKDSFSCSLSLSTHKLGRQKWSTRRGASSFRNAELGPIHLSTEHQKTDLGFPSLLFILFIPLNDLHNLHDLNPAIPSLLKSSIWIPVVSTEVTWLALRSSMLHYIDCCHIPPQIRLFHSTTNYFQKTPNSTLSSLGHSPNVCYHSPHLVFSKIFPLLNY